MKGFEGFKDSPEAPFYRAGAMSAEATWAEASRRLVRVLRSAVAEAQHRPGAITAERICAWHRAILLTTFERDAGRVRADDEPVEFGVPIETAHELHDLPIRGTLGRCAIMHELVSHARRSMRVRLLCATASGQSRWPRASSRRRHSTRPFSRPTRSLTAIFVPHM
jgi:hypothetical protein